MEKKTLFTKPEFAWMMYDWANSAYSILIAVILPLYAASVAETSGIMDTQHLANWGDISSIAGLVVAVLAPILGAFADYRSQRMRLFAAFFVVGTLSTGLLSFSNAYVPLLILYGVTQLGFSGANVFYDAFLVDVTTPDRMNRVSSWGFALGYIGGSTIPFLVSISLVLFSPLDETLSMRISCMITAVWWILFTIPFFRHVRQHTAIEREPQMLRKSLHRLLSTLRSIRHYKYMLLFLIAYFFYIDGVGTIIKMATTYAGALNLDQTTILLGLLVTQVVAFPCSILYGNLGTKYSAKRLLQFGILTYLAVCGVGFIMKESWHFYLLATLVGTAQGGIQALSRSYFGRLIEDKRRSGEFFGFYNIFGKFESVLGTFLMARVVSATGNVHFGVFPVLASFIVGFVLLLFVPSDKCAYTMTE